jgi:formylglycine-generating enzyme required for sulfatase activity
MSGLPSDLNKRLRDTLVMCPQFDTDENLRAIFVDERIFPWRNALSQAISRNSRVQLAINFLYEQQNIRNENALVLLLQVLSECVDLGDILCHKLSALADEVERCLDSERSQSTLLPEPLQTKPSELSPFHIPETILIPAGEFWMGSEANDPLAFSNETPLRKLRLPKYAIGKYPVTNTEYLAFVTATGHRPPEHWPSRSQIPQGKEHHPVVKINLRDAQTYCEWLTKETDKPYRLPTEEEWEKAARGALDTRRYPWGDNWNPDYANTKNTDSGDTTPVNAFEDKNRSPDGVIDMVGNVWEWTSTPYKGERYVIRGGSFRYEARFARNSCRGRCAPEILDPDLGFRIVKVLGE